MVNLKDIVSKLEKELGCNCDLDNWQPEPDTGHSWVCRIHRSVKDITILSKEDLETWFKSNNNTRVTKGQFLYVIKDTRII